MNQGFRCICAALTLCVLPAIAGAQEEAGGDEELRYRNSLGIKVGNHHEDGHDDTLVGIEYTRILSDRLGVTVAFEKVDSAAVDREEALAVIARVGFARRWVFLVGPGAEFTSDAGEDDEEFFFRTGLAVEFELGESGWFLEPLVELDLFRSTEKYFIGVKFGKGF